MQTRGPADTPWFSSHYSQRPFLSGDRLPDLHLPQSYVSTSAYSSTRAGGPVQLSNGHGVQFPPLQTGLYSSNHSGIGLKTPSPSPTCSAPPGQELVEDTAEQSDYSQSSPPIQHYTPGADHLTGAMNQQPQYLGSEPQQMSAGQPYQPQPTTTGALSQYPNYPHQHPILQSGTGNYAPPPGHYAGQYGYPNGVPSPQGAGHPASSSLGPQMNPGLLPSLPSKLRCI